MRIAVIDGQGGGIGRVIVEKISQAFGNDINIVALGTNTMATSSMLKAGANEGATGEHAIIWNAPRVNLILGPIGILTPNTMLGEWTPKMAEAISDSPARKVVIPLCKWNVDIIGIQSKSLPQSVDDLVVTIEKYVRGECHV
ncbi:DUF3842 family protein [Bacillus massiliigorillae]|uniref:DUF3842 family protein n=1 Tax=Bacillus massiliigorillae TaxID=1243664 RepID=UPI00039E30E8|nr:DUF3842 family protein [Bacillus massiliigorillae]